MQWIILAMEQIFDHKHINGKIILGLVDLGFIQYNFEADEFKFTKSGLNYYAHVVNEMKNGKVMS